MISAQLSEIAENTKKQIKDLFGEEGIENIPSATLEVIGFISLPHTETDYA